MKKIIIKGTIWIMVIGASLPLSAQFDAPASNDNIRRSIWDKEPEPKTDAVPFSGIGQPLSAAQLPQNGTLGGPGGSGLQGGASGPDGNGVPIDGGLSFVLAGGIGLGVQN